MTDIRSMSKHTAFDYAWTQLVTTVHEHEDLAADDDDNWDLTDLERLIQVWSVAVIALRPSS